MQLVLRSADGGYTRFGQVPSPARSEDETNIGWGLAATTLRSCARHDVLSLRGVETAARQIGEADGISRRKRDGRDQVRLGSHRAGVHGFALNAQPASPANR